MRKRAVWRIVTTTVRISSAEPTARSDLKRVEMKDNLSGPDRLLMDSMEAGLRSTGQYIIRCPSCDSEQIAKIRSLGRRVGRALGWKVRTFAASRPSDADDTNVIIVVEESTPLHEQLMRVRGEKAMRRAINNIGIEP